MSPNRALGHRVHPTAPQGQRFERRCIGFAIVNRPAIGCVIAMYYILNFTDPARRDAAPLKAWDLLSYDALRVVSGEPSS